MVIEEILDSNTPAPIHQDEVIDEIVPEVKPVTEDVSDERLPHRAILEEPYTEQIAFDQDKETIPLPSGPDYETREKLNAAPHVNLVDNVDSRKWANTLEQGLEFNTFAEGFIPTLEEQDALFKQSVEFNGQRYAAQAPRVKQTENESLKGERAVLRVIRQLGLGTTFQVPLWHSGIWVTLKPPTEAEIIELNRLMIAEKIRLGRYTYGLVYSNLTSYTVNYLVDFILSHVYSTTIKNEELPVNQLKDHIAVQDLFTLVWGFACTMYPKGFQYRRACINDPEKCNHVIEEKLNLNKLLWTNVQALTEWQKSHMASRQPFLRDLSAMKKYKEEMLKLKPRRIKLTDENDEEALFVTIRTPSLTQYIDEGEKWVTGIVNKVTEAISDSDSEQDRNAIIHRHAQASAMRQYAHWVESIEIGTNIIDDAETLNMTLDVMSSNDAVRIKFIEEVVKYINESTISVVGIPVYDCPKCGHEQQVDVENNTFKNIIPLDVIQLFFALITQRIQRIAIR